jgi:hypothetical protein
MLRTLDIPLPITLPCSLPNCLCCHERIFTRRTSGYCLGTLGAVNYFLLSPPHSYNNECSVSHCASTPSSSSLSLTSPSVLKGMVRTDMHIKELLHIEEIFCTITWGNVWFYYIHFTYLFVFLCDRWFRLWLIWISRSCIVYLSELKINWSIQNELS